MSRGASKLAELAIQLGDDGFFLVAINVDQGSGVGLEFLRRYKIQVPAFQVNRGDLVLMGVDALPTNILLDRDGEVVQVFKGFDPPSSTRSAVAGIRWLRRRKATSIQ